MKTLFVLLLSLLSMISASGQWTTSGTNIYNSNTGNVGIGLTTPVEKLQIAGNLRFGTSIGSSNHAIEWFTSSFAAGYGHKIYNLDAQNGRTDLRIAGRANSATWTDLVAITNDGRVGIGTMDIGTFRLAVEGRIGAREVRVTNANPWPDYVFGNNYNLRSLADLEQYITENKRLPNMPSAEEVQNNGIELGRMNTTVVEKIEELTLYIITLNKRLEILEKENAQLRNSLKN